MTFPIDVDDDGSPRAALDIAGQGVRAFNHRSAQRFDSQRNGWNYVPDVYRCIGELTYLTGMLPQVFDHMTTSMRAQLDEEQIAIDAGTTFAGDPSRAVETACAALAESAGVARALYAALAAAQVAINAASFAGSDRATRGTELL